MPCYFFHVRRGQLTVLDREGIELAGEQILAGLDPALDDRPPRLRA